MKAVVKIPFFDETGLHKVGDVIEIASMNRYLDKYAEKSNSEVEAKTIKKRTKKNVE